MARRGQRARRRAVGWADDQLTEFACVQLKLQPEKEAVYAAAAAAGASSPPVVDEPKGTK